MWFPQTENIQDAIEEVACAIVDKSEVWQCNLSYQKLGQWDVSVIALRGIISRRFMQVTRNSQMRNLFQTYYFHEVDVL